MPIYYLTVWHPEDNRPQDEQRLNLRDDDRAMAWLDRRDLAWMEWAVLSREGERRCFARKDGDNPAHLSSHAGLPVS
jgi:hypothetical protein